MARIYSMVTREECQRMAARGHEGMAESTEFMAVINGRNDGRVSSFGRSTCSYCRKVGRNWSDCYKLNSYQVDWGEQQRNGWGSGARQLHQIRGRKATNRRQIGVRRSTLDQQANHANHSIHAALSKQAWRVALTAHDGNPSSSTAGAVMKLIDDVAQQLLTLVDQLAGVFSNFNGCSLDWILDSIWLVI